MRYDEILKTRVAFGTAPGLIDRLGQLCAEPMRRTLRILTQEIMPALK